MRTLKQNYRALKRKQQQSLEHFEGIFYAFSEKQFKEGLEKL